MSCVITRSVKRVHLAIAFKFTPNKNLFQHWKQMTTAWQRVTPTYSNSSLNTYSVYKILFGSRCIIFFLDLKANFFGLYKRPTLSQTDGRSRSLFTAVVGFRNLLECAKRRRISERSEQRQQHRTNSHFSRSVVLNFALLCVSNVPSITF